MIEAAALGIYLTAGMAILAAMDLAEKPSGSVADSPLEWALVIAFIWLWPAYCPLALAAPRYHRWRRMRRYRKAIEQQELEARAGQQGREEAPE